MKPSSDLYSLIHALSSTEKNYIKKYAGVYSKSKHNYYKLLEAIHKQEEYDEKALLIKFRKESFVKHFAVTKNQLMELILKLLRQFHQKNSIHATINAAIENARLLYERGLFSLGSKQVDKAYTLAEEHHAHSKMQEILNLKRIHIVQFQSYSWLDDVEEMLASKENLCNAEIEYIYYGKIYYKLLFLIRQNVVFRRKNQQKILDEILPNGELRTPRYKGHFYTQERYLYIQYLYSALKEEFAESMKTCVQIIDLWEASPKLIQKEPDGYLVALNTYSINAHRLKDWLSIDYIRPKLDLINQQSIKVEALVFENKMLWTFNSYIELKRYDELIEMLPEIEKNLARLQHNLNKVRHVIITMSISYLHLLVGAHDKALEYVDLTLDLKLKDLRLDLQLSIDMMFFFIHYKLGNVIFLDSALKNYRRKIKKKGLMYELEDLQLRYLLKLCAAVDKSKEHALLASFQQELQALIDENPRLTIILDSYLNLEAWIESVKQNCTMKEILERTLPISN
jgi:hypothetical protein